MVDQANPISNYALFNLLILPLLVFIYVSITFSASSDCRCIVVTTTLSEDTLMVAEPSLIRKEIGYISLQDILGGGSGDSSM